MTASDHGDRLDALEMRIAYQDRTIEDLNAALTGQWQVIDRLTRQLALLEEQVRSGGYIADPDTEKPPPHY
ncbi:SlyX family protein [Devosia honganensis]|uniref:Protein SlyX homolog n=1 Tax=Devosia honganensis TaxID=1610527 RepID=A0ABV7X0Y3_9HYPH